MRHWPKPERDIVVKLVHYVNWLEDDNQTLRDSNARLRQETLEFSDRVETGHKAPGSHLPKNMPTREWTGQGLSERLAALLKSGADKPGHMDHGLWKSTLKWNKLTEGEALELALEVGK